MVPSDSDPQNAPVPLTEKITPNPLITVCLVLSDAVNAGRLCHLVEVSCGPAVETVVGRAVLRAGREHPGWVIALVTVESRDLVKISQPSHD